MKKIILILTITITLFAQYEWSDPVQLSGDGIYPATGYWQPAITVDYEGCIYAFWIKNVETDPYVYNSNIEMRKSFDDGLSWTEAVNITPDYTAGMIYDVAAVCDSLNNVHVIYGTALDKVFYKKFNGTTWSDQVEIYYRTSGLKLKIDSSDRLFATWWNSNYTYYAYHDAHDLNNSNWTYSKIDYFASWIKDFTFDENDNVYAVGQYADTLNARSRPFYCEYKKARDRWENFKEINYFDTTSSANAVVLTSADTLKCSISFGSSDYLNTNYIFKKSLSDITWTNEGYVNSDVVKDKEMIIDGYDRLHLFESKSYERLQYTYDNNGELYQENIIGNDSIFSYGYLDCAPNNTEKIFIVYGKYNTDNNNGYIFFQSRQMDTGINEPYFIPSKIRLEQNYPNPFNNATEIEYSLKTLGLVKISVFNSQGQFIKNLVNEKQGKGKHSIVFNAKDLNSGVYYYQLEVDGIKQEAKKMLYLR